MLLYRQLASEPEDLVYNLFSEILVTCLQHQQENASRAIGLQSPTPSTPSQRLPQLR